MNQTDQRIFDLLKNLPKGEVSFTFVEEIRSFRICVRCEDRGVYGASQMISEKDIAQGPMSGFAAILELLRRNFEAAFGRPIGDPEYKPNTGATPCTVK